MIYERDLSNLVVKERIRALTKGHQAFFNSLHEGFAVMQEEKEEFEEEYKIAEEKTKELWDLIKKDKSKVELMLCIKSLKESLGNAFDEFIMFYTMLNKLEAKAKGK